ncbi:hypothetical protein DD237_007503 [Peronospora effusa]|uniref:Uncharacterized protein n=1 Tax=Peronospora effusa TaxID=542832 RepID=A0A3R7W2T8_9STRA|nr:hypothetical protein DD237_007503 [Peronospora effusa]
MKNVKHSARVVELLKQRFGQSYIVEVKMQGPSLSSVERLQIEVQRILRCNSLGILQDHINILFKPCSRDSGRQTNGTVLQSYLETSGIIPIDVFCAWWYTKDVGGCQLVGHQGDHFCFQVPKQSLRPYAIFGFLEGNNERLHIDEYVEEQLELYAHLKGISSNRVKSATNQKIEKVELIEYRTKQRRD